MIFLLLADLHVVKKCEQIKCIYELSTKDKKITAKGHL